MIVTGALPWYNERPEDLDACIRGLGNIADRVIALDGAYVRYPNATARSTDDQVTAIQGAAAAVGLECLVLQPNKPWAGQVAKRSYLLAAAAVNSDWICTVDADHVIHADRQKARAALEGFGADVVDVTYYTPANPDRPIKDSAAGIWHIEQADGRVTIPHFYRALPGIRIEKRHWWYSAIKNGKRVWLWSSAGDYPTVPHDTMPLPYEVEHRCLMRTEEQIRLSRAFLNDREMVVRLTDQEDDVPGLPVPLYDYERMPA